MAKYLAFFCVIILIEAQKQQLNAVMEMVMRNRSAYDPQFIINEAKYQDVGSQRKDFSNYFNIAKRDVSESWMNSEYGTFIWMLVFI